MYRTVQGSPVQGLKCPNIGRWPRYVSSGSTPLPKESQGFQAPLKAGPAGLTPIPQLKRGAAHEAGEIAEIGPRLSCGDGDFIQFNLTNHTCDGSCSPWHLRGGWYLATIGRPAEAKTWTREPPTDAGLQTGMGRPAGTFQGPPQGPGLQGRLRVGQSASGPRQPDLERS